MSTSRETLLFPTGTNVSPTGATRGPRTRFRRVPQVSRSVGIGGHPGPLHRHSDTDSEETSMEPQGGHAGGRKPTAPA
jgi:hypothetical protein